MSELKLMQQQYRERLNDPSYVAPRALRSSKQHVSRPNEPQLKIEAPDQAMNEQAMRQYVQSIKEGGSAISQNESGAAMTQSERQRMAQSLGMGWQNNSPVLNEQHEQDLERASDISVEATSDDELNQYQQTLLDLMTDWRK